MDLSVSLGAAGIPTVALGFASTQSLSRASIYTLSDFG
jgi:hypothetical protein